MAVVEVAAAVALTLQVHLGPQQVHVKVQEAAMVVVSLLPPLLPPPLLRLPLLLML
jgi:hypothetical protein